MGYRSGDMTHALETDLASGALAEIITDIAEEAARLILPYWRVGTTVETKSDASPVTEADRAAEALILQRLAERWPGVQTVAEEAVAADGAPASVSDWFWLIDPLDGLGWLKALEAATRQRPAAPAYSPPTWPAHFQRIEARLLQPLAAHSAAG